MSGTRVPSMMNLCMVTCAMQGKLKRYAVLQVLQQAQWTCQDLCDCVCSLSSLAWKSHKDWHSKEHLIGSGRPSSTVVLPSLNLAASWMTWEVVNWKKQGSRLPCLLDKTTARSNKVQGPKVYTTTGLRQNLYRQTGSELSDYVLHSKISCTACCKL